MDEENIFLGEASYRFIRIPVNQKYSTTRMSKNAAELLNSEQQATVTVKNHVRKYKDRFFHRFSNIRCRVWFAGAPRASTTPDKHQNLQRR
jgi:hypothetical protein